MAKFEDDLFESGHRLLSHVSFWRRSVDDKLRLWTDPTQLIQEFLLLMNGLYPCIRFILEVGDENINFLDLLSLLPDSFSMIFIGSPPPPTPRSTGPQKFPSFPPPHIRAVWLRNCAIVKLTQITFHVFRFLPPGFSRSFSESRGLYIGRMV